MSFHKRGRRGAILVLAALSMVVLMGFAGLAVDAGLFWATQRRMQTATDAAAIAGAIALRFGRDYTGAAKDLSSFNGYTDASNGVSIAVNNPPLIGRYAANQNFLEVTVSKPEPSYFMRVLGTNAMTIKTRAVASWANGKVCVYVLDKTAAGALNTDNAMTSTCGVYVNSSSPTAITAPSPGRLTSPVVGIVGSYTGNITATTIKTGVAPAVDPLSYLRRPTVGPCTQTNYTKSSGAWTLNPGVYCGGITLHGSAAVTLNPGMYILNGGGLTSDGTTSITGIGVTFFNTEAPGLYPYKPIFTQDSNTLVLVAPTSGYYAGILFFQDPLIAPTTPNFASPNIIAGGSAKLEGALYFPTTPLAFSSQSAVAAAYTIMVAKTITNGVNSLNIYNDYSSLLTGSPIKVTVLYE